MAGTGENKIQYNILARTREGKRPLEKSRRRRKDKTKIHPEGTRRIDVEWIHKADGRDNWQADVNAVMNFRVA